MDIFRFAQNAATAALVCCAILVTTVVVRREFLVPNDSDPRSVRDWRSIVGSRPPALGSATAKSRMVVFSDYECPYCRDLDAKLARLVARSHGELAIERLEFPIVAAHPNAYEEAVAAKCAARQNILQQFQSRLFSRPAGKRPGWEDLAGNAGLPDVDAFLRCVSMRQTVSEVESDIAVAKTLGIDSVPAFIVDGKLYTGTRDMEALEDIVSEAL